MSKNAVVTPRRGSGGTLQQQCVLGRNHVYCELWAVSLCVCFPSLVNGRAGFSFLSIEGLLRTDAMSPKRGKKGNTLIKEGPMQFPLEVHSLCLLVVLKALVQQV